MLLKFRNSRAIVLSIIISTLVDFQVQSATIPTLVEAPQTFDKATDEITMIAWLDSRGFDSYYPLVRSQANIPLRQMLDLGDFRRCLAFLGALTEFRVAPFVFTNTDRRYANAFLLVNSANSRPPTFIDPSEYAKGQNYRLFNNLKAKYAVINGQVSGSATNVSRVGVQMGPTLNPCVWKALLRAGPQVIENHLNEVTEPGELNGTLGVTTSRDGVYQVASARVSQKGQIGDTVLNDPGGRVGATTPFVWGTVRFDTNGEFVQSNRTCNTSPRPQYHQIFPTYSVYRNGVQIAEHLTCDPEVFMDLDETSHLQAADFFKLIR